MANIGQRKPVGIVIVDIVKKKIRSLRYVNEYTHRCLFMNVKKKKRMQKWKEAISKGVAKVVGLVIHFYNSPFPRLKQNKLFSRNFY